MDAKVYKPNPNPAAKANIISKLFVWWIRKLVWKGKLTEDDLFDRLDEDASDVLADRLEKSWDEERMRAKEKGIKPSFTRTVLRVFWLRCFLYGVLQLFDVLILRLSQPLLLGLLIPHFSPGSDVTRREALLYASALVLSNFARTFWMHHYTLNVSLVGMRVRVACCSLLYRKVLRMNRQCTDPAATGQIINLMSNDVARLDVAAMNANGLWASMVGTAAITYCLYRSVSWAGFAGVASVAIMTVPTQIYIGKLFARFRNKIAQKTDERMRMMNEIVQGIQVIKMYAWEKPFAELVAAVRKTEYHKLLHAAYLKGFLVASSVFMERSSLLVTLLVHFLLGQVAGPEKIFAMAQFFNILNFCLAMMFPMAISSLQEAKVSVQRIEDFLLRPEAPADDAGREAAAGTGEVSLQQASASWDGARPTLADVSLRVASGVLCAVVGPVGCGKSSLLYMLINELNASCGKLRVGGRVSYASQEPWVFMGSVRQNILFGQPFERRKYQRVVEACALARDFELLPHGDQTLVGEKGVTLSGGQRARVSLARAVYRDADIYLLDDPLSAVDTHVGKHLFDECICSYLGGKTRILVTHQLQHVQGADNIVVLNKGKIEHQGTFEEIIRSGVSFSKLMSHSEDESKSKEFNISRLEGNRKSFSRGAADQPGETTVEGVQQESNEEKAEASFRWAVVLQYLRAGGGPCLLAAVAALILAAQAATSASDYVITCWSDAEVRRRSLSLGSSQTSAERPPAGQSYLRQYAALVASCVALNLARVHAFFFVCLRASRTLHDRMFGCVLRAAMRFFDTNPSGRILNRFSKDIGSVDEILPMFAMMMIQIYLVLCGILAMVIVVNYIFVIPIVGVGAVFVFMARLFMITGRNVKSLEGIRRSPVYSHLSDTINGLATIRASGSLALVKQEFDHHQDRHTSAWFLHRANGAALGIWLDFLSSVFVAVVTYSFFALSSGEFGSSGVGLAISQSLILTGMLQVGIVQTTEVVSQMTSVERVIEYTRIPAEGALESDKDATPPTEWPQRGKIVFEKLHLKYNASDPPVLKDLNFTIEATEKVGIVGRTGAGKSSLISALFRLAPTEGAIVIDGVDTSGIGLHDLRRRVSIIPQEPVLFSESLRYNLDPFSEFEDAKLWEALEEVELKSCVETLDFQVTEGGSNFSVGQRQLICLARAILRNNKILVLDEATANVDPETDALIQCTIRRKFQHCTVLTIAHRLNTVMDSDKVLVMSAGSVVEFDHPHILLKDRDGFLSNLVAETGTAMAEQLRNVAEKSYAEKVRKEDNVQEVEITRL